MSEHIDKTIAHFQEILRKQEAEAAETKRTINSICKSDGRAPLYPEDDGSSSNSISAIRSDQFYGRPLATVMQEYLWMREKANLGAATTREIYEALVQGGYEFGAKNAENAKRGLQISLSKNRRFHRIPSGAWGLTKWYPNAKQKKTKNGGSDEDESSTDELEVDEPPEDVMEEEDDES